MSEIFMCSSVWWCKIKSLKVFHNQIPSYILGDKEVKNPVGTCKSVEETKGNYLYKKKIVGTRVKPIGMKKRMYTRNPYR